MKKWYLFYSQDAYTEKLQQLDGEIQSADKQVVAKLQQVVGESDRTIDKNADGETFPRAFSFVPWGRTRQTLCGRACLISLVFLINCLNMNMFSFKLLRKVFLNALYSDDYFQDVKKTITRHTETQLTKQVLEQLTFGSSTKGVIEGLYGNKELIVSLTTHGKRIETVYHTIESIFQQTLKPNRVILWLGNNEWNDVKDLPISLQTQMSRGLEIFFVKDIRSYTKLLPALKMFPSANIVTVDDDILYPRNLLERLWKGHVKYQDSIISVVSRQMRLKGPNEFDSFINFKSIDSDKDYISLNNIAEGFAGVLYPSGCFDDEVFNESKFLQLCPSADDIWFCCMALKAKTPVVQIARLFDVYHEMYQIEEVQDMALANTNIGDKCNDSQLNAVFNEYNLWSCLQ